MKIDNSEENIGSCKERVPKGISTQYTRDNTPGQDRPSTHTNKHLRSRDRGSMSGSRGQRGESGRIGQGVVRNRRFPDTRRDLDALFGVDMLSVERRVRHVSGTGGGRGVPSDEVPPYRGGGVSGSRLPALEMFARPLMAR